MDYEWVEADLRLLRSVSGRATTPQIFADGTLIGGAEDLAKYLAKAA
jgi:glutaredoxin